jgi:uncharacterized membrane protein
MRSATLRTPLVAALLGLATMSPPATGQDAALQDGRWLPFLGCWVEVEAVDGPMTCIVPEGQGVAVLSVADAQVTDRRAVLADGLERDASVAGCTGGEAAEFSPDGHRVYTRSTLDCGGQDRRTRGLMAMVDSNRWIEARALGVEDGGVAWVRRYRPAPATRVEAAGLSERLSAAASPQAVQMARASASGRITTEDIIEAHERTHPEAVRAWIAEHGEPLRLDAHRLVQLADAGVPPEVIDVAVAVSFPDRFDVARAPGDDPRYGYGYAGYGYGTWGAWSPFNPYYYDYYDPFYYRYSRYSSYYGSGWYGPGYTRYIGYRPTIVVVSPSTPQTRPAGRLIKGQGYTRGTPTGTASRPSIRPTGSAGSQVGTTRGSSGSSASKGKAKPRGGGQVP